MTDRVHLRPEAEVLLCCARTRMDPDTAARLSLLLQQPLDWDEILRTADQHRVLPLLQRHLRALHSAAVPAAVLERLQRRCRALTGTNLLLAGQLLAILELLERNGIAAIPFKGVVLAAGIYGNLALRQPGDLDLLVRHDDLRRAADVLAALGYRPWSAATGEGTLPAHLNHHEYRLFHAEHGIVLELRWRVMQPLFASSIAIEDLWQRREEIVLASGSVPGLSPEDLLLILCDHGTKHTWSRLAWICDVAELVRSRPDLDWALLQERADALGITRALALGLLLAHGLLGAAVPRPIREWAGCVPWAQWLMSTVCGWLFRPSTGASASAADGVRLLFYKLRLAPHPRDRCGWGLFLARRLIGANARDRTMLRLPAGLGLRCYPLRGLRLLGAHGLAPLGRRLARVRPAPGAPAESCLGICVRIEGRDAEAC